MKSHQKIHQKRNVPHEDYLLQKQHATPSTATRAEQPTQKPKTIRDTKQQRANRKQANALERSIAKKETEIEQMTDKLSSYQYGSKQYNDLLAKVSVLQQEIDSLMKEWEQLI